MSGIARITSWLRGSLVLIFCLLAGGVILVYLFMPTCILSSDVLSMRATANAKMRNIAVAIEEYHVDHGHYPPSAGGHVPILLTSPTVYMKRLPEDPFYMADPDEIETMSSTFRYQAWPGIGCIIASNGPDLDMDISANELTSSATPQSMTAMLTQFGGHWIEYDPSNGTTSNGDILRWGP